MERVKAGAELIVVDPCRTTTAAKADLFLQIRPGTDLALPNGLLHLLHEVGRTDPGWLMGREQRQALCGLVPEPARESRTDPGTLPPFSTPS
ncbi:hypothetical protein [Streptomyces sp. NPDC029554]|uniref:hypothetical protein n=1 Tax=Streptomyces sp. NPDC029554 TaxID=3155126 RepID=UPI0033D33AD2